MGSVIFILLMAVLFFVLGLLLFRGRCSWMIAGYNTASDEERAKYDERKICRIAGITCQVVTLLLLSMAYLGYRIETGLMEENQMIPFSIVFCAVLLCMIGFDIYYMNCKCKKVKRNSDK